MDELMSTFNEYNTVGFNDMEIFYLNFGWKVVAEREQLEPGTMNYGLRLRRNCDDVTGGTSKLETLKPILFPGKEIAGNHPIINL